jgi:WhiB family transcriptional regulator, redox-sensing transcriptional regulator
MRGSPENEYLRRNLLPVESALVRWLMVQSNEDLTTIDDLFGRPDWQRYGACRGEDIESFIPNRGGTFSTARDLCRECSVRLECLDFAMADDEIVGMWGGTTERERREMRAGRGAA